MEIPGSAFYMVGTSWYLQFRFPKWPLMITNGCASPNSSGSDHLNYVLFIGRWGVGVSTNGVSQIMVANSIIPWLPWPVDFPYVHAYPISISYSRLYMPWKKTSNLFEIPQCLTTSKPLKIFKSLKDVIGNPLVNSPFPWDMSVVLAVLPYL